MNDGKEVCQAALKPAIDRVNAVKQYGSDKYNQGKEQVNHNLLHRQKVNGMERKKVRPVLTCDLFFLPFKLFFFTRFLSYIDSVSNVNNEKNEFIKNMYGIFRS